MPAKIPWGADGTTDIALVVSVAIRHVVVGLDYLGLRARTTGGDATSTVEAGLIL